MTEMDAVLNISEPPVFAGKTRRNWSVNCRICRFRLRNARKRRREFEWGGPYIAERWLRGDRRAQRGTVYRRCMFRERYWTPAGQRRACRVGIAHHVMLQVGGRCSPHFAQTQRTRHSGVVPRLFPVSPRAEKPSLGENRFQAYAAAYSLCTRPQNSHEFGCPIGHSDGAPVLFFDFDFSTIPPWGPAPDA